MPLDGGSPAKADTWDGGRKLREVKGGRGRKLEGAVVRRRRDKGESEGQVLNKIRVRERSEMAPFVSVGDFNRD